jgi:hypothetical protein
MNDSLAGIPSSMGHADEWSISILPAVRYQGWVESALSRFSGFIDKSINPRDYYLDTREIAEGPAGTTVYVARLADLPIDGLMLPVHIKAQDQQDRLAGRPTLVAIKSVPILPSGSAKLTEVLHELTLMRDLRCENILAMDALYVDPIEDTLWIRMELMTKSLYSIIDLSKAGLKLLDPTIAGCTKDVRGLSLTVQSMAFDSICRSCPLWSICEYIISCPRIYVPGTYSSMAMAF